VQGPSVTQREREREGLGCGGSGRRDLVDGHRGATRAREQELVGVRRERRRLGLVNIG
jgi:hypothetical protein